MMGVVPINRISQEKSYIRKALTQRKSVPIIGMPALVNMLNSIDCIHRHAPQFAYPFMMMQGSLDTVVSNNGALSWYSRTSTAPKKEKHMFEGFVHELHKEPGKHQVFKRVLLYMSTQLSG